MPNLMTPLNIVKMRYIRNQIIVQTIYDGILADEEPIVKLIENLIKINVDVHFEFRNPIRDFVRVCEKTRILSIKEQVVKIRVFVRGSTEVIDGINIHDIEFIKVVTGRSIISLDENNISLGEFIDFT